MKKGSLIYRNTEIEAAAELVTQLMTCTSRFALTGSLGAGKTTLIQHVLRSCGVSDTVQSPTFTYASTYTGYNGTIYHHFDLYRLKNSADFIEAGFMEYLEDPTAYVFIEWPEIILSLLTTNVCFVALEYLNEEARVLRYEVITKNGG
jgi:tRNA threonylcarbamoyladenosine biosynthesis protein TsaE